MFLFRVFCRKYPFFTSTNFDGNDVSFVGIGGLGSLLLNELNLYPELFPATITSKSSATPQLVTKKLLVKARRKLIANYFLCFLSSTVFTFVMIFPFFPLLKASMQMKKLRKESSRERKRERNFFSWKLSEKKYKIYKGTKMCLWIFPENLFFFNYHSLLARQQTSSLTNLGFYLPFLPRNTAHSYILTRKFRNATDV